MQLLFDLEYMPESHTGHLSPTQDIINGLKSIHQHKPFKNILEFGFNTGWSSALFLTMFPEVCVTSIEILKVPKAVQGCEILKKKFPGRFDIIWGDSKDISKQVCSGQMNLPKKYDVAFIDGGHYIDIVDADITMCKHLGIKNFIFDDAEAPNIKPAIKKNNLQLIKHYPYQIYIKRNGKWKTRSNKGRSIGIQHYES